MNLNLKQICPLFAAAVAIVVIGMPVGVVSAATDAYRNYASIKVGMHQPAEDLDKKGYDTGFNAGATYGRYLSRHLVLEASIDGFSTERKTHGATSTAGGYLRKDNIGVVAVLATLKGELPIGPMSVFAGAGVGAYFMGWNSEVKTDRLGTSEVNDNDQVFGAHVMTGAHHDIGKRFFVGVEGMYRWTRDVEILTRTVTVPIDYSGNLNGYTVAVRAGFRF